MKSIELSRLGLLNCLSIGGMFAGRNKTIPVLECVKCKLCVDGSVVVSSFDGQNYVTKRSVGCVNSADSDIIFCVKNVDIVRALKSIKDEIVLFDFSDSNNMLTIRHKKGTLDMPIMDVSEFPTMDLGDVNSRFAMDSALLREWCGVSRSFAGQDMLRPVMSSMYLYVSGGELGVCATDSKRLYTDSIAYENENDINVGVCVPVGVLSALQGILGGNDSVTVSVMDRYVSFSVNDARVTSLLMEGRYPNFKSIIPKETGIKVVVGTEDLLDSVQRLSLQANMSNKLLRVGVDGMSLDLLAEDVDFSKKAKESCMCDHSGGNITIGLNADYLSDCLNAIRTDDVELSMSDPSRPVLVRESGNERKILLLMPLMLS